MSNFTNFAIRYEYERIAELGDKLGEVEKLIDWEAFRPFLTGLYSNNTEKGGRPNLDEILMLKMLILQQWHGLSDPELERQANDRISFRQFLGFPDKIPDRSTIWAFRERLSLSGKDKDIWNELQRQLDAKGLTIKKGMIQDATFIHSDPGHASSDTPRGEEAKTRRSKDGTWTKKGGTSHFGFKLHAIIDREYDLIRRVCTTTASVHDSQIDLSEEGEVVYRDRGYQGAKCKGYDATMKRGARGHPIGIRDKLRNERISRKRTKGERPFAVIKSVFTSGTVRVTELGRVRVKNMFSAFSYNLYQLRTIEKQSL
ncbi:IS5 family transposase [Methanogenium sp. S4BF]|uniref:IS5 family transposase n=1 Tax=Methanogenium sp. S4BF TaxID=1789226 RepID=UPI0024170327|nr:IS5 family transposase [Methanogenium sp. S4BF]WFN35473.1 IS5 family transposase [Methanogenium sp. S4BF]WFN35483.1 IS5 family transposase [Methanogenium sp. S4BF]WFN35641.1 IS5 family transposase [Methanogenium sp. S4BF]